MFKMSNKQTKKLIFGIIIIILSIFAVERIYNSRDKFNVSAKDDTTYGIVEGKLSRSEKLYDFDYLYDILEVNYPFFEVNKRLHGIDWLGNKSKYRRIIKNTESDVDYFAAMEKILGDLNDDHLSILDGEEYEWFFNAYYYGHKKHDSLNYFARYDALNNFRVMYRYKFSENIQEFDLYEEPVLETKSLIKDELAYIKIKEMVGLPRAEEDYEEIKGFLKEVEDYEKLIIDIRGNNGEVDKYWENIVELLTDEPLVANYFSFFKEGHRFNRDAYKVEGVTTIKNLDDEFLDNFPKEVRRDYSFYKENTIRIDPLGNSQESSEDIDFSGKIYLLVDEDVRSSAEKFASFAKDTGFATLVGETTGGNRVFEETPLVFLPKTVFVIRYSRELGMNMDGSINMETRTEPHIEVDSTPNENFKKDLSIQAVIED